MLTYSYPDDECCILYDHPNFGGYAKKFCLEGQTDRVFNLRDYDADDDVSSLNCGYKVKFELCDHGEDSDCSDDEGHRGAGNVVVSDLEDGEDANTLFLHRYDSVERPAAMIFEHPDCRGHVGTLWAP